MTGRVGTGREIRRCGTAEPKLSACPVRPCTGCWKLPEGSSRLPSVLFNYALEPFPQKINQRRLTASCQTTSKGRRKDGAIPPTGGAEGLQAFSLGQGARRLVKDAGRLESLEN